MQTTYTSTKIIELGSCAFRQYKAATGRIDAGKNSERCSKVHGYRLTAKFWINSNTLDERNWVFDFAGLTTLKEQLQHQFDHTLCIAKDDPLLPLFQELNDKGGCDLRVMDAVGIERTAEYCFNAANEHVKKTTNGRCWVSQVEVWEHENNSAIFYGESTSLNINSASDFTIQPMQSMAFTNLMIDTKTTQDVVLANVEANTQPAANEALKISAPPVDRAANVGANVSKGKDNWFSGTSWGN